MHRADWPVADAVAELGHHGDAMVLADASVVLAAVRKAKSEAKTSMRTEVAVSTVTGPEHALDRVRLAGEDVRAAGHVAELRYETSDGPLGATVTL